jgi:hypothetical protein
MVFYAISEMQQEIDQTLGFKILPHCTHFCTDDDFDYGGGGGGGETLTTPSCGVQYTRKCIFTYCHKKSTAFPAYIFIKLKC